MTAPWKDYEAKCARYLSDRLDMDVVTTRKLGMGMQVGYDLALKDRSPVLGWHIECKYTQDRPRLPEWVDQAAEQAEGGRWVVWTNHQGRSSSVIENSPGHGFAYCRLSSLVPQVGGTEIRRLSIASFVDLLVAFRGWESRPIGARQAGASPVR